MKLLKSIIIALALSSLISCVPEGLMRTWQSDQQLDKKFNNLMVIGLVNNPAIRGQVEDEVVYAASRISLGATNGMSMFPPELGKPFDDIERVKARLREKQFDGVMTITLVDYQEERYISPSVEYAPLVFYDRFGRYYYRTYDLVYREGYFKRATKYFIETNLYELGEGKLIWSGRSRVFEPSELDTYLNYYARGLFKELKLDGVI